MDKETECGCDCTGTLDGSGWYAVFDIGDGAQVLPVLHWKVQRCGRVTPMVAEGSQVLPALEHNLFGIWRAQSQNEAFQIAAMAKREEEEEEITPPNSVIN